MGKKKLKDPLKGKVLVAKIGKEAEFAELFAGMTKVANGPLGWDGMADMFMQIGAFPAFGENPKNKEEAKQLIIQSYLNSLYEVGEWIPKKKAEQRKTAMETLYGKPPKVSTDG